MSIQNNILSKAISALHPTEMTPPSGNDSAPILEQQALLEQPLVFLSPDFTLTGEEESLLKDILDQFQLTPNLTLFDLLFFDLHKKLTSLKKFVQDEDFSREIENLEICYALLIENEEKDTEKLKHFLKNLILNLIKSNNILNTSSTGSCQSIKAAGDTQLILKVLFKRVALFKKFEAAPACHAQLFSRPLSLLTGTEKLIPEDNPKLKSLFANNALFLQVAFNSLLKIKPELILFEEKTTEICQNIGSIGDPGSKTFLRITIDTVVRANNHAFLLSQHVGSSYWIDILLNSFPIYTKIAKEFSELCRSLQTEQLDLAFQMGISPDVSLRSRSSLDPNDKLAKFKANKEIESSFQLTSSESDLIQEIFNYPLDSNMNLLDLLGFALYDKLEQLKQILPQLDQKITDTQGLISARRLLLYAGLSRSVPSVMESFGSFGAINKFSERFASFPHTFPDQIDRALRDLQEAVKNIKPNSQRPTKMQINGLQRNKNKILDQLEKTIVPLRNLLIKLLQSQGHLALLINSVSLYQGSETLEQDHPNARIILEKYSTYIKSGYSSGVKLGLFGVICDFNPLARSHLPFSAHPLEEEMSSFGINITTVILAASEDSDILKQELQAAVSGKLDHKTWLATTGITSSQKNQQEFVEQLYINYFLSHMQSCFFSDMLRFIENRVFPRGTLTTQSCFFRLLHNLTFKNPKVLNFSPSSLLPKAIPLKFKAVSDQIQSGFTFYSELLNYVRSDLHVQEYIFNHANWLAVLLPIKDSISLLFKSSLQTLSSLKIEFIQDLKNEWSLLTLEQLQSLDLPQIKDAIFNEGTQLVRPLLILSDMLAILQLRRFSEEAAIIPTELADIMILDDIDKMYVGLIKDKTPLPTQPIAIPVVAPALTPKTPVVPQKTKTPLKKTVQKTTSTTTTTQPKIEGLAQLTKSRAILKRLKELNFFEDHQTGSHHILKGPGGGTVVVPNNSNLPLGTRKSIAKQATDAL